MNNEITKLQKESSSLVRAKQNAFRKHIQSILDDELKEGGKFQAILAELEPKDYIEVILKLMPYAYSKAPEEKPESKTDVQMEKIVVRKKLSEPFNE